ncbi:MAG: hypothetical protein IKK78_00835, partial [Oscillospiraceae bacterium]|nr:hypothetical protein [Oscillospiraceae bacterium]
MKSMKLLLQTLVCMLLVAVCAFASAEAAVNCYWQLDEVRVETFAENNGCDADITVSAEPLSGLSIPEMISSLRGNNTMSMEVVRTKTDRRAAAEYTYSTVPALVPGAAAARISFTADTQAEDGSYYLYTTLAAGSSQVARMRGNGAWVLRTFFPRQAVPGAEREMTVTLREYNGLATARVVYAYKACPGAMVIDTNNDIVLYDLDGNEIDRIGQSVEELLPVMTGAAAGVQGDTIFSAEAQEDGSLIVRLDPDCGLSHGAIIQLIRAAAASAKADASSSATAVSSLTADENAATLYLAPGAALSDDVLSALIAAAQNQSVDAISLQGDINAGEVAVAVEQTPTPAPLSYAEIMALIASGETVKPTPEAGPENSAYAGKDDEAAQAVVLYGETGVEAVALVPGAEASGSQLLTIIEKLEEAGKLSESYAS